MARTEKKLPETFRRKAVTFDELADDALELSRAENEENTTYNLELKFELFREWFGKRLAESINKQEIIRCLLEVAEERDWAPASFNRWQSAISLAFRVGVENEKISMNPASKIKKRTENNGRIRFLSNEEEDILRTEIFKKYPHHLPAFLISVHTGARASEQFRMQWRDLDFERRILTIPKTKNGDTRYIPLNQTAISALNELRKGRSNLPWVLPEL